MGAGIYVITNLINGKKYVGQSVDVPTRIIQHRYHLNAGIHYNDHLQRAWNKYGKDNFRFDVLEYCDIDELDDLERKYISEFDTMNDKCGYNLESGGHECKQLSDETKKKLSEYSSGENNPMYGIHLFGDKNGMYDKNHSEESKQQMGETKSRAYNSTGFFKVYKNNDDRYLQGFRWHYSWTEDGKRKEIASVSILDLEKKVRAKGLHWEILDEELAKRTIEEDNANKKTKGDYNKHHSLKMTSTGIFRVSKKKSSRCKQGFMWQYQWTENGIRKAIMSVSLMMLKKKVEDKGLQWEILDGELAEQTIKEDSNG